MVLYEYLKKECEEYGDVGNIPTTSTGKVRRELKQRIKKDYKYKSQTRKATNVEPHIYNMLLDAFMGGYTHSNWVYTDEIVHDVDSWDFTSSYPYVMVTHKFPMTKFQKGNLKKIDDIKPFSAWLVRIEFKNIKCKYYNHFISQNKCIQISNGHYDNGRVIQADYLQMVVTDIDLKVIADTYDYKSYKILESYHSKYDYLPKPLIDFILDKYVAKTELKGVPGKEVNYAKEKNLFNSIYGMAVTNTIREKVEFTDEGYWVELPLTNEEIVQGLENEELKAFLSFAWGVWVTAYARNNLIRNIIKLDDYEVYSDTDSLKVLPGYDKKVIDDYNDFVERKIRAVSKRLEIPFERFAPKGKMLGVFDFDGHYESFVTLGAKKYAYTKYIKNEKIKDDTNIIEKGKEKSLVLEITVAGVPKQGALCLKSLDDFKEGLVFSHDITKKNMVSYVDNQISLTLTDYLGNKKEISDKSGVCILPITYELGMSDEYAELVEDNSSKRERYRE